MYVIIKNGEWSPRTQMAEQEFLCYYFGKTESWHALGPQYNVQTHQLFLSSDWEPPRDQTTSCIIIRGNTDSSQLYRRTLNTYFANGDVGKYERGEPKMVGGINAGLIVSTPSTKEFEKMYVIIKNGEWSPRTQMAEQEFLCYYFGKTESWHALGPQYNVQTHQLFLSSDWEPPRDQTTSCIIRSHVSQTI